MANKTLQQYLIYLRKSQKDKELEDASGRSDTLKRHREKLLSLARERHYEIAYIYEEVVSGDTIAERPEMQKLLRAVESGDYSGVLVMEISRLARGNTRDQGVVAETFLYSGTKIITPDRIYNTAEDADEEYLEFELFMARREYKAINRRQQRGKMASLHEGKYIGGTAPYGYEKVKLSKQKGSTLHILPEKAEVVREIFSLYTVGELQTDGSRRQYGAYSIANLLNRRGISSPSGKPWTSSSVKELLTNPTYAGYVRWGYRAPEKHMRDGIVVESRPLHKDATLVDGMHEAIISQETWENACRIRAARSHAPLPTDAKLSNPLAGLVFCANCGRAMLGVRQHKSNRPAGMLLKCPTAKCQTVSSNLATVENMIWDALLLWLHDYKTEEASKHLPPKSSGIDASERELTRLQASLSTTKTQQNALHDLLEQGLYDKDTFLARSQALAEKWTELQRSISENEHCLRAERILQSRRESPLPSIEQMLRECKTIDSPMAKNRILKALLQEVFYAKTTGGRWIEGDLQLYLFPTLNGKASD